MPIVKAQSMTVWEAGTYPAKILSCEQTKSTYPGKEETDRFKWVIRVSNEDGEYTDVWHFTNATLSTHVRATFRPMARTLLPELDWSDKDVEVDTDDMVGKRCRVILGINEEKGRNVVEKILAPEAKKARPAPVEDDEAPASRTAAIPF